MPVSSLKPPTRRKANGGRRREIALARQEQPAGGTPQAFKPQARPVPAAAFPPLDAGTRETLPTDAAAFHLLRQPQTLRGWACLGNGPIHPVRINGRLGWRTADIRRLLGVSE